LKTIDICLTPRLIPDFDLEGKIVVVVDVLRATTCMITALAHKVDRIIPVSTLKEAADYRNKGYIVCAERDGRRAEGFDLGNSPFGFMDPELQGRTVVMTTTNGTKSIVLSKHAEQVVIGAFVNISALKRFLALTGKDVVIVCAGWKDRINAEDTLFAGALCDAMSGVYQPANDAVLLATTAYICHRENLKIFLARTSHYSRLMRLGLEEDIDFCLKHDLYQVIPKLDCEGALTV